MFAVDQAVSGYHQNGDQNGHGCRQVIIAALLIVKDGQTDGLGPCGSQDG